MSLRFADSILMLVSKKYWDLQYNAPKMKFSIKDFFSKCDQIHSFLQIWSHLFTEEIFNGKLHFLCSVKITADRLDQFTIILLNVNII